RREPEPAGDPPDTDVGAPQRALQADQVRPGGVRRRAGGVRVLRPPADAARPAEPARPGQRTLQPPRERRGPGVVELRLAGAALRASDQLPPAPRCAGGAPRLRAV